MMRFTPKTENELQMESLVPEGIYSYQVIKSEDAVSHAGNEYIKFTIKIWDSEGREHLVFTNLALIKLLKHFCDVNGMESDYESGDIPAEKCIFKSGGKVLLGVEGEKPNPNGGMYRAKNIVKDYVSDVNHQSSLSMPLADAKKDFISDDLPF